MYWPQRVCMGVFIGCYGKFEWTFGQSTKNSIIVPVWEKTTLKTRSLVLGNTFIQILWIRLVWPLLPYIVVETTQVEAEEQLSSLVCLVTLLYRIFTFCASSFQPTGLGVLVLRKEWLCSEDKIMILLDWKIRFPPCQSFKETGRKKGTQLAGIRDLNSSRKLSCYHT